MERNITTPTRFTFDKVVHTPPSIDHDNSISTRHKLLKGISGKVFRKTPDLKLQQNATFTFTAPVVPPTTPLKMSKRRGVPSPLDLYTPMSPPPTVKKASSFQLNKSLSHTINEHDITKTLMSPVTLYSNKKNSNVSSSRNNSSSSFSNNSLLEIATVDEMNLTDNEDYELMGEDSPTYPHSISKNIKRSTSNSGPKRFIDEKCTMCGELMKNTFVGEKIVELTCSHTVHFDCYFLIFESIYFDGKFPECKVCLTSSKPKDEEMLQLITSKALTISNPYDKPSCSVQQQWIDLKSAKNDGASMFNFTPMDQVVRTADITCDGFRSSLPSAIFDDGSIIDTYNSSFLEARNLFPPVGEHKNKLYAISLITDLESPKEKKLEIVQSEIKLDMTKHDDAINVTVYIQDENLKYKPSDSRDIESQSILVRNQIENYFKSEIDPQNEFGDLCMFDKTNYSTDGELWIKNILAVYFAKYLILYDFKSKSIAGKIPIEEVSKVNKMDTEMMIIDIKSRTLPEIYFSMVHKKKNELTSKWKFYLENIDKKLSFPLHLMTETGFDILPGHIELELKKIIDHRNQDKIATDKPWEIVKNKTPIKLIVCFDLSTDDDIQQYQEKLKSSLTLILSELESSDLLGLVILGVDGSGTIGEHGKFVGYINKYWAGWDEIISELEVIEEEVFDNSETLVDKAMESSYRLLRMTNDDEDDDNNCDQPCEYIKKIILLGNGDSSVQEDGLAKNYKKRINEDYNYSFEFVKLNEDDISISIQNMHKKLYQNITVTFEDGKKLLFGNMSQNEEKTLKLTNVSPFSDDNYEISWYNYIKDVAMKFKHTTGLGEE